MIQNTKFQSPKTALPEKEQTPRVIAIGIKVPVVEVEVAVVRIEVKRIIGGAPKFAFFHLVQNTGAGFGILKGYNLLMIIVSVIALGFFIYYFNKNKLACSLVVAGIIGNLVDRVLLGGVRDFIDLRIWPVFNLADSMITVGIGIYLISFLKSGKHRS